MSGYGCPLDDRAAAARARSSAAARRRARAGASTAGGPSPTRRRGRRARGALRAPRGRRRGGDRRRGRGGEPGRDLRLRPAARRRARAPCCCGRARTGGCGEPDALEADLERPACRSPARIEAPGTIDGGDTLWLDRETLLVGRGYRTNAAGVEQLQAAFPDAEVLSFDLPHWNGRGEVMHLMSLISPLDDDLALVYPRLAPVRLLELLAERGIATVEVPDEEFETMGPNVLALGPRRALALEGNDETRRRMEARRRRRRHLQGRRDLPQGRRRPDLPDATDLARHERDALRRDPAGDVTRCRAPRARPELAGARTRTASRRSYTLYNGRTALVDVLLDGEPGARRVRGGRGRTDARAGGAARGGAGARARLGGRTASRRSTTPRSSARRTPRGSCSNAAPTRRVVAQRQLAVKPLHSAAAERRRRRGRRLLLDAGADLERRAGERLPPLDAARATTARPRQLRARCSASGGATLAPRVLGIELSWRKSERPETPTPDEPQRAGPVAQAAVEQGAGELGDPAASSMPTSRLVERLRIEKSA